MMYIECMFYYLFNDYIMFNFLETSFMKSPLYNSFVCIDVFLSNVWNFIYLPFFFFLLLFMNKHCKRNKKGGDKDY